MHRTHPVRVVLAVAALLVPFCACHALALVGRGTPCCGSEAQASGPMSPSRSTMPAASECSSGCCGARDSTAGPPTDRDGDPDPAPDESNSPAAPRLPGCGSDACCVRSAPSAPAWQLPAPALITIIEPIVMTGRACDRSALAQWPPILPLGQPPPPLDAGTILLV